MNTDSLRGWVSAGVASALLGAFLVPGCGGSDTRKIRPEPDASVAEAGEGGAFGGSGPTPAGGVAGARSNGGDAAGTAEGGVGNGNGDGIGGQVSTGGDSSLAGTAGSVESSAGAGGEPTNPTLELDAGVGCVAPRDEAPLSAASAGLPASGLVLWLRGDRGVYLTASDRVCAWADQSGQGRLFTPSADSTRPLWAAASLGGQAAVHFDASGRWLTAGGVLGIQPSSGRTLVAVVELVSTTTRCSSLQQGEGNTPGTYLMLDANTFVTAGSREGVYAVNNSFDSALVTSAAPRVHVFTLGPLTLGAAVLGAVDYRVNGATQTLTRTAGSGNFGDFSNANYTLVGGCTDALIAEALIYDRVLTVPERAAVEAALEARYDIK